MLGSHNGVERKYHIYDVPNGRFSYVKTSDGNLTILDRQRVQRILVAPNPGDAEYSTMFWSRNDPIDEFFEKSVMIIVFIALQVGFVPISFWLSSRG